MKITKIKFTNINESSKTLLLQNMLSLQRRIVADLGSLRKFAEAREFQLKSNELIAAFYKELDPDKNAAFRIKFVDLCDQYRGQN